MEKINVLIVDDDPEISSFMKLMLSKDAPHLEISCVESGRDCLDYIGSNKVDCILSDLQMPGMSGLELLKTLRGNGGEPAFIFVTGQGNEELAREAFKSGAYDYFTKDIGFAHFPRIVNSMEQALRQRQAEEAGRRARAALVQEKNKFEAILAGIGDGISIQDKDLVILYQNDVAVELFGDHLGRPCYEAYKENQKVCEGCPVILTMSDAKVRTAEMTARTSRGVLNLEVTTSPLTDSHGNIIAGIEVIRDRTERKKAEESLLRSRQALNTIIESMQFGMMVVGKDRRVRRANSAALKMMGYSSGGDVVGGVCHKNICPSEKGSCPILDKGLNVDLSEKVLIDRHGNYIPILKTVTPVRLEGEEVLLETFVDITERMKVKEALSKSEEMYHSLFDDSPISLWVHDCSDVKRYADSLRTNGLDDLSAYFAEHPEAAAEAVDMIKVADVNNATLNLFKASGKDELKAGFGRIFDGDSRNPVIEGVVSFIEKGYSVFETETSCATLAGDRIDVAIKCSVPRGYEKTLSRVIVSLMDITGRNKAEADRCSFFSMLTHDLKTPLSIISGYSGLMLTLPESADTALMAQKIQSAAGRINSLIDDMMELSMLESRELSLELGAVSLKKLVGLSVGENEFFAAGAGVSVSSSVEEGVPDIRGDVKHLSRALGNLVSNAINYNSTGGSVKVRAGRLPGRPESVFIEVLDTGEGISREDLPHVFEKYYRSAKSSEKFGTGLGLSIVKAVVESHGGSVTVSSEEKKGTRFTLVLPVDPAQ